MNLTHATVIAASLYVLIAAFKKVYPEWKTHRWLVRVMPILPIILGMIVAPVIAYFMGLPIILAVPYGVIGGALSTSAYEMIHKTLMQSAGSISVFDKEEGERDLE